MASDTPEPEEGPTTDLIERLRSEFAEHCHGGQRASIAAAMSQFPGKSDRLFRELLLLELQQRSQLAETVDCRDYLNRFPEYAHVIELIFKERSEELTQVRSEDRVFELQSSAPEEEPALPKSVGRFQVVRLLGAGAFGCVYLAKDPQLNRQVAIKVIKSSLTASGDVLNEARNVARLAHEGIVTVYDVEVNAPEPFIVQEYVSGEPLSEILRARRLTISECVRIVLGVAEALAFAHKRRIFHRDLKPGNILIDRHGVPRLIDFGLALHERDLKQHKGEVAGSLRYMSPEQWRGESHRIDDRTDIWGLSVIFYRMLTGRLPFQGRTPVEVSEEVQLHDPTPPRQIDETIPRELERIVLIGLSKRMADRYSVCDDLLTDLRQYESDTTSDVLTRGIPVADGLSDGSGSALSAVSGPSWSVARESVAVVPRGLGAFSKGDADFFPALLPGPFDRAGLPASIRFWLERLGNTDPDEAIPVGLIYGQSGCGKSSLLRAGVLPRLDPDVITIFADCTHAGTEDRIVDAINSKCGEGPEDTRDLLQRFVSVRESSRAQRNPKVVVVLDQFEQWLHGKTDLEAEKLTMALRQCDGVALQAILVVRDDFWLAITRFFRALEIPIAEEKNATAVELFSKRHAKNVLRRFGAAYESLPAIDQRLADQHEQFLEVATNSLTVGEHVRCVTLSLFAHMMKDQEWTAEQLKNTGGAGNVGLRYVERVFEGEKRPLLFRNYGDHAKRILQALLPERGQDLKGHTLDYDELLSLTGLYFEELDELLQVMDSQLSLISVSEVLGESPGRHYRLAHDYLVEPIREWFDRSERRTLRGRAAADLRDAAEKWNDGRPVGLLPSVGNYARYRFVAPSGNLGQAEADYLSAWRNRNYIRVACFGVLLAIGVLAAAHFVGRRNTAAIRQELIVQLADADGEQFEKLARRIGVVSPEELAAYPAETHSRIHVRAWISPRIIDDKPLQSGQLDEAIEWLVVADPLEVRQLVAILKRDRSAAVNALSRRFLEPYDSYKAKVRISAALLLLGRVDEACLIVAPEKNPAMRSRLTLLLSRWVEDWSTFFALLDEPSVSGSLSSVIVDAVSTSWDRVPGPVVRKELRTRCLEVLGVDNESGVFNGLPISFSSSLLHLLEQDGAFQLPPDVGAADRSWFTDSRGIRFVRLSMDPDSEYHKVFLSDREISNRIVQDFVRLSGNPFGVPSEPREYPAHAVSLLGIAKFCNWLSDNSGLEPCFGDGDKLEVERSSGGYRIPKFEELLVAGTGIAGRQAAAHCGEDLAESELFGLYEVFGEIVVLGRKFGEMGRGYGGLPGRPPGSRLPNSAGFSDVLGNVAEWTCSEADRGHFRVFGEDANSKYLTLNRAASLNKKKQPLLAYENVRQIGFRLAIEEPVNWPAD